MLMNYGQRHHILCPAVESTLLCSLAAIISLCVHHIMLEGNCMHPCQCRFHSHFAFSPRVPLPLLRHHHQPQPLLFHAAWTVSHRGRAERGWRNPLLPSLTFETLVILVMAVYSARDGFSRSRRRFVFVREGRRCEGE